MYIYMYIYICMYIYIICPCSASNFWMACGHPEFGKMSPGTERSGGQFRVGPWQVTGSQAPKPSKFETFLLGC